MTLGVVGVTPIIGAAPAQALSVSGFGNYCSVGYPDGTWSLAYLTNGGDPCGDILNADPSGTIQRKGLFAPSATNNVVLRCRSDQSFVATFKGSGLTPINDAFDNAKNNHRQYCTFTVSPQSLPIFVSPFPLDTAGYVHVTGFDFAQWQYGTLNVNDFGQPGSTSAKIVDNFGRDETNTTFIDDHDGHDYDMPRGTPVFAMAAGKVVMARAWDCKCKGSDSNLQQEIGILHTVKGKNGYSEQFISYYAHFGSMSVHTGDLVTAGQQIGLSGNTGSSTGPHLHVTVIRVSNTASKLSAPVKWYLDGRHDSSTGKQSIEFYGFKAPKGFDPYAYKAFPDGGLSVDLFKAGQAPPEGNW